MKNILKKTVIVILFFSYQFNYAQSINLKDPNVIIKDDKGNIQNYEWATELLKKGSVSMRHNTNTKGKKEITLYLISNEELIKSKIQEENFVSNLKDKNFPEYNLTTLEGNKISNKDIKGKIVVYNFWFTSCAPCIAEMPELNKLVEKYKDNKNIVFLAPTFEKNEEIKKFLKRKNFNFKILQNSKQLDKQLEIQSWPTTIIADNEGMIKEIIISGENIFEKIDQYIKNNI